MLLNIHMAALRTLVILAQGEEVRWGLRWQTEPLCWASVGGYPVSRPLLLLL